MNYSNILVQKISYFNFIWYPNHLKVVEKPHIMQMISVMMITIMKNVALMGVTVVDLMLIINTVHIVSVANMKIVMLHTH